MAQLSFKLEDLKPIIAHSKAAPQQQITFGMLCDKSLWKTGAKPHEFGDVAESDIDLSKVTPGILFVKDDGAYLMSGGTPAQMLPDNSKRVVVYAKGCDPRVDEDCWDTCSRKCGGDDFAETLPVAMFDEAIAHNPNAKRLIITLTARTMRMHAA